MCRKGGRLLKWIDFEKPKTIEEAVKLLSESGGEAKPLAGGTDLIVQLRVGDPRVTVSYTHLTLPTIYSV